MEFEKLAERVGTTIALLIDHGGDYQSALRLMNDDELIGIANDAPEGSAVAKDSLLLLQGRFKPPTAKQCARYLPETMEGTPIRRYFLAMLAEEARSFDDQLTYWSYTDSGSEEEAEALDALAAAIEGGDGQWNHVLSLTETDSDERRKIIELLLTTDRAFSLEDVLAFLIGDADHTNAESVFQKMQEELDKGEYPSWWLNVLWDENFPMHDEVWLDRILGEAAKLCRNDLKEWHSLLDEVRGDVPDGVLALLGEQDFDPETWREFARKAHEEQWESLTELVGKKLVEAGLSLNDWRVVFGELPSGSDLRQLALKKITELLRENEAQ